MLAGRFNKIVPEPEIIIDVGVADGTPWLYDSFPDTKFLLFDPMKECEQLVRSSFPSLNFEFFAVALSKEAGTAELKIPVISEVQKGQLASLVNRTDQYSKAASDWLTREVEVATLDSLIPHDGRLGLKIDTEGFESQVLDGAKETLKRCTFVVLELSLEMRFEGVDPPSVVVRKLEEAGFELRDVLSINGGSQDKSPRHIDCLFVRWC